MYDYFLGQWILGNLTSNWVKARIPRWITQSQTTILATPQDGI